MKFINISQFGGPEVLVQQETETPKAAAGEVLIEVHAAGINRPDVFQRQGTYPPPPGASVIPGLEVAGVVVSCGEGVQRWKKGDQVCALVSGGGYAEYVNVPEGQCLPIPHGFDFIHAAALPETFFTVWTNLFEDGRLIANETALIHGGAGGIGTTAIQMAKALGAKVLTTAGKKESVAILQELGADRVILYKEEDFVKVAKEFTHDKGVNVILDMVGGDYFVRNLDALAYQGRLVQIASLHGAKVELDISKMMMKRLMITGSTLRPRNVTEKSRIARALEEKIWPLLNQGKMKPHIFKVLPLEQASEGHRLMEESQHTGKIILKVK
ncbi:NAD(P)H-quinone oxidoreductase [Bdellovibrio sp. NC01]|uniref:NAD(P)H-quinone oxidoreductase n=1 Tax=Bdellovibrio sp. NC01 TaxID=2220073 RepID=UPI00115B3287|nr:NAD(P)H-quinone oxidoreductase [Bdellovibrio sp. NC01]QDK36352.1 NAD(P)H-quinone oxidoreductase [Bdellovibrio sp. NC01]